MPRLSDLSGAKPRLVVGLGRFMGKELLLFLKGANLTGTFVSMFPEGARIYIVFRRLDSARSIYSYHIPLGDLEGH